MITVYDGKYIEDDIAAMPDADLLDAFLTELAEQADAVNELTKWPGEFNSSPMFETEGITHFQKIGYNLYRIKPRAKRLGAYRIIFAYNGRKDEIYFLAVVKRKEYNYESDHNISSRVFREYFDLGIPRTN